MTSIKKIIEHDANELQKFKLLPSWVRPIGWIAAIASSILSIALHLLEVDSPIAKEVLPSLVLLSMLLISVSKEQQEDEYLLQLRHKSYYIAFVIGVLYAVFQPIINYVVASLIHYQEGVVFEGLDSFVVLWFMLFIQLGFYYVMKATR